MPESSRHVMITEIGHFALVLALCVSVLQASLPLYGAARGDAALMLAALPLAPFAAAAALRQALD